jgi:hypothetical protein
MSDFSSFRQRLDAVLRTLDVNSVRQFLIAEGQWEQDAPADPEFAMWLMVAGSPTLRDLHQRARTWLVEHGHEEAAQAVLGKGKAPSRPGGKQGPRGQAKKTGRPSPTHPSHPKKTPGSAKSSQERTGGKQKGR